MGAVWPGMLVSVAIAAGAATGGCAEPSIKDPDPGGRLVGIQQAVEQNDRSAIPDLIEFLDSDDAAVRLFSIQALEHFTGQTLGYDHAAPERERRAAADRWAKWYQDQQAAGAAERRTSNAQTGECGTRSGRISVG